MPRRKRKGKRELTRLPDEIDLCEVFGGDCPPRPNFANEIDTGMTAADLPALLAEKKGIKPKTPTMRDKLRHYPHPQEELDLHGTTGSEAAVKVIAFINAAGAFRHLTIRIITGKGIHTEGPAVLPPLVEATLADLKHSGRILHYRWDKKRREKSGSVVVYLK